MLNREDYVDLEVAKTLREKGYNECSAYAYNLETNELVLKYMYNARLESPYISAPTIYEVQDWLRKKFYTNVLVDVIYDMGNDYYGYIIKDYINWFESKASEYTYSSYKEALHNGLKNALKSIKF